MIRGETGKYCIVAIGAGVHSSWNAKSYIIVDGFTLRHIDPFHIDGGDSGRRWSISTAPVLSTT